MDNLISSIKNIKNLVIKAGARIPHPLDQIEGLPWLNQWFDNVMDNLPELAICYRPKNLPLPIGQLWLSKSSGADTIRSFNIYAVSKNESGPLSLVIRSCAHEQFARLIMRNEAFDFVLLPEDLLEESVHVNFSVEEFVEDLSIPCMEYIREVHVGRAHAPQLQTDLFSPELAAVHQVCDGINSLIQTRQILSEEDDWSSPEEKVLRLLLQEASKLDRKFWSLSLLLAETYLCLGDSYKESGQLRQALCTMELACTVYASMPIKFEDTCFVSAFVLNEPELPAGDLGDQNKRLFWGKAWCLVGEIYTLLGKSESEEDPEFVPIKMPCEIKEEVERVVKNLWSARDKICVSCALLNCICSIQKSNSKKHKRSIFSYVKWSSVPRRKETILEAASDCFEEAHTALLIFPKASKIAISRKGRVQSSIGHHMLSSKLPEKAEIAFAAAVESFREAEDFEGIVSSNLNRGYSRLAEAEEKFKELESGGMGKSGSKAYKKACGLALKDYICALQYYMVAKTESTLVSTTLKIETYKRLGDAYLRLGHHLSKCDIVAEAAQEMESSTGSGLVKLTVEDCMKEAANLYEAVNIKSDAGGAYIELANHYRKKFLLETTDSESAREHYLLADRYWDKTLEVFGPENENDPKVFLLIMKGAAELTFMFAERSGNKLGSETLEKLLCRCFEARHISEVSLRKDQVSDFWSMFQKILKLFVHLYYKSVDPETKLRVEKLKSFYGKALDEKKQLRDLNAMHVSWTSEASQSEIIRTSDGKTKAHKDEG